ncbi:MAG: chlorite dismutase family protein [Ktedonobacterales bacterium]
MAQTATSSSNTYTAYWLYQVDPDFRRLSDAEQRQAKAEFLSVLEQRPTGVKLRGSYSLVGLREDVDFMLWVIGPDLDDIQRLAVKLRKSGLGRYLTTRQTYIGVVTAARYDPGHQAAFMLNAVPKNYVSVYPFVKTTEWYLLPFEQRRELMAEHGVVGRRYAVPREKIVAEAEHTHTGKGAAAAQRETAATAVAEAEEGGGVLSNTVDAFGLGDYEFILANESDDPAELCHMMESLRRVEVRRYTKLDTPIFLGRRKEPDEVLADL